MTTGALIVAAGRGTRAGGGIPKQYRLLHGEEILRHTLRAILASDQVSTTTVVIHPDDMNLYQKAVAPLRDSRLTAPALGGATRSQSVLNGLKTMNCEKVIVHDGARPLLPLDALTRLILALEHRRAAFLAIPVTDALWTVEQGQAQSAQPRDKLWRGQTPQGFRLADIIAAHEQSDAPADDDVAMARRAGLDVAVVIGSERNIKITRPEDFDLAEQLMGKPWI